MTAGTIATIIILAILIFGVIPVFCLGWILYSVLLVRTKPEKWARECSMPEDEEYLRMFKIGEEWNEKYKSYKRDVSITSCGLRLCGEYFDFGFKRAVIIIAGRMEACTYSYYFAEPYRAIGYNVLVIDNRAHGLSEGKYYCLGVKEYRDIINWSMLLHDELGNESVVLHGICIGSATALYALISDDCPEYISAMVAEGMYNTFCESFKCHMKLQRHHDFPLTYVVMMYIRLVTGKSAMTDGPVKQIGKLRKPALFLHSREDQFSLPELAEDLYKKCNSEKQVVWFDKGTHSRIRINNTEAYDSAIKQFLNNKL